MNILDKLSIAAIGISIAAVTYDDISQDVADLFGELFEAEASISDIEINPWKKKIRHETLYCENEDNNTCVDLLEVGFNALGKKPNTPTKRISKNELFCLAQNIYFEARGEGINGMTAVGAITLNRVHSPDFPNTICDVVFQTKKVKGTLIPQMEWTVKNNKKLPRSTPIKNRAHYERIAAKIINGTYGTGYENVCDALFWVNPNKMERKERIKSWHAKKYFSNKIKCSFKVNEHVFFKYEA